MPFPHLTAGNAIADTFQRPNGPLNNGWIQGIQAGPDNLALSSGQVIYPDATQVGSYAYAYRSLGRSAAFVEALVAQATGSRGFVSIECGDGQNVPVYRGLTFQLSVGTQFNLFNQTNPTTFQLLTSANTALVAPLVMELRKIGNLYQCLANGAVVLSYTDTTNIVVWGPLVGFRLGIIAAGGVNPAISQFVAA